jgi:predicted CoA-substrate-specific enzyme activase
MIHYICKWTPVELFAGFGEETAPFHEMAEDFDLADKVAPVNLCGFGRALTEAVLRGHVRSLILVNCCDTMRRTYDILAARADLDFLYILDLPHEDTECEIDAFAASILRLKRAYEKFSGKTFDRECFLRAFSRKKEENTPYVGILGVKVSPALEKVIADALSVRVENETCLGSRSLDFDLPAMRAAGTDEELFRLYAEAILRQMPCCRMTTSHKREKMFLDERLQGIIYHTIKFCDFYGFEYARMAREAKVPLLKIETDYTAQSMGQLKTRIEAFAETIGARSGAAENQLTERQREMIREGKYYTAGIDSGSTSTDVVILDQDRKMVSSIIIPTGGGASMSAETSLAKALEKAGLTREQIVRIVTTGYGRAYIDEGDASITEITCHAKGAHFLNPRVRTIIDIGGQDSKAIRVDEAGAVQNFLMNDKCAAGTGRFLETMAKTLGISLTEMSTLGLDWKENVTISSMCTVFAESEVVSLVAQNKALPDIIHGLNVSVASKVGGLASRLGEMEEYMMTGGVARNQGIVKALEEKIGHPIYICEEAQICGALGAALFALEKVEAKAPA